MTSLKTKRRAGIFDAHLGHRLKTLRNLRGLTQEDLAKAIKVTYQQIQKYEDGSVRLSASSVVEISKVLKVPVSELLDPNTKTTKLLETLDKDALVLLKLFSSINDPLSRRSIENLIRSLIRTREHGRL